MHSAFLDRYIEFTLHRRWLVLASSVVVMLVLTAGLQFLNISNDWRDMLDEDNPQLVAFDALEDTYTATNAAVIAVAPKGGSVFTREALAAIEELTEAAWEVPWSSRVDSPCQLQPQRSDRGRPERRAARGRRRIAQRRRPRANQKDRVGRAQRRRPSRLPRRARYRTGDQLHLARALGRPPRSKPTTISAASWPRPGPPIRISPIT